MADLGSFRRFVKTASTYAATALPEVIHVSDNRYQVRVGGELVTFDTPGGGDDSHMARWYGLYLKKCHRKGVEPGPFRVLDEDELD